MILVDVVGYNKIQGQPFKQYRPKIEAKIEVSPSATEQSGPGEMGMGKYTEHHDRSDKEGFSVRPGSALVSRLRRLRHLYPGAGHFPRTGDSREKFVVVSGIGCSSRFPYYMNTFGFHSIHGRAPAVATGIKVAHPELEVWVATGDGDSLSIGGNHTIHMLRRNVGIKVLMFNNRIYGLTKGQYSPTSEFGKKTKSTPFGSDSRPFNPLALALGVETTFVARSVDVMQQHLKETLKKAAAHKGAAYIEILQNCNIFNDGAWQYLTEKDARTEHIVQLEHGKPLVFGKNRDKGIRQNGLDLEVVQLGNGVSEHDLLIHDAEYRNPVYAFLLAKMEELPGFPTPIGVLRSWNDVPRYEDIVSNQVKDVIAKRGAGDIDSTLLRSGDTWEVRVARRQSARSRPPITKLNRYGM